MQQDCTPPSPPRTLGHALGERADSGTVWRSAGDERQPEQLQPLDKAALARLKNREAQQRFRERQRQKHAQQAVELEQAAAQLAALQRENKALARQNLVMEHMLAVRDAMLAVFEQAGAGRTLQPGRLAELQEGGRELVQAVERLPSESEMRQLDDDLEPVLGMFDFSPGGSGDNTLLLHPAPPGSLLPGPHQAGASDVIDGSALRQVASIPQPNNEAVRAQIVAMQQPDELVHIWQAWQVDLCAAFQTAQQAGFDAASLDELRAVYKRMEDVWWLASHHKPAFLTYLAHEVLPPNSAQHPAWPQLAEHMLEELTAQQLLGLRRAWQQYIKRLSKCAVGCASWLRRLQSTSAPTSVQSMHSSMGNSVQLAQATAHVAAAINEEYLASMEFLGTISKLYTLTNKSRIISEAAPFMPDHVCIAYHLLKLHERSQASLASAATSIMDVSMPDST